MAVVFMVVPAKGTSERLPNKNLRLLAGKPLVRRACERVLRVRAADACWLDTEDHEIIQTCESLIPQGLSVLRRPPSLVSNETTGNDLMVWELNALPKCDILCQTFATSPLLTTETIDRCIEKFLAHPHHDSFFTVAVMRRYFWRRFGPVNFSPSELPNSQDLDPLLMETHGLYGIRTEALRELKTRVGRNPLMISVSKREALDIDDEDDLWMAERLIDG